MKKIINGMLVLLMGVSCKDPFEPPVTADQVSFLAVDGQINSTDSSAVVKLSKAVKLSSSGSFPEVNDATVSVEDEDGLAYPLPFLKQGIYQQTGLVFNASKKYRVRITTADGKNYSSSLVKLLATPEIDSVRWQPASDGVGIFVSSRQDSEASRFYRWSFDETWQYTSTFASALEISNEVVGLRYPNHQTYNCWMNNRSTDILIKSTDLYGTNAVNDFKLAFLAKGSPKLYIEYSTLVKQMSITEEAYNFWDQLKKATQSTGGLFDPIPSQVFGNLRSENDPGEIVLGFFSASSVTTKRIFIHIYDLPASLRTGAAEKNCKTTFVPFARFSTRDKSLEIISTYGQPVTIGYTFSTKDCVDCRFQGGTNVRPSFWN